MMYVLKQQSDHVPLLKVEAVATVSAIVAVWGLAGAAAVCCSRTPYISLEGVCNLLSV
jgi:hypothetical protein